VAKFIFRLEAVLEQRRAEERTRRLAVADLERQRLDIEAFIRECAERLEQEKQDLRDHLGSGRTRASIDLRPVRLQAHASLQLVSRAQQAVVKLAGVHSRLDSSRLDLLRATTRRRAIEVLRDRQLEAWKMEIERRENQALDELNVARAGRGEAEA
jgi:flagellar export protein FliJ